MFSIIPRVNFNIFKYRGKILKSVKVQEVENAFFE